MIRHLLSLSLSLLLLSILLIQYQATANVAYYDSPNFDPEFDKLIPNSVIQQQQPQHLTPSWLETQQHTSVGDAASTSWQALSHPPMNSQRLHRSLSSSSSMPWSQFLETKENVKKPEIGPFGEAISDHAAAPPKPNLAHQVLTSHGRFEAPAFTEVVAQMKEIASNAHPDPAIASHHKAMMVHHRVSTPHVQPPMAPPPPPTDALLPPTTIDMNVHSMSNFQLSENDNEPTPNLLETQAHAKAQTQAQAKAQTQAKMTSVSAIRAMMQQRSKQQQQQQAMARRMIQAPPVALLEDRTEVNAPWRKY